MGRAFEIPAVGNVPFEVAIGLEQGRGGNLVEHAVVEVVEQWRFHEVVLEAVFTVQPVHVFAEAFDPLADIADALAADLHQFDIVLGEDGSGAGGPGQRRNFAEQNAGVDCMGVEFFQNRRHVTKERQHFVVLAHVGASIAAGSIAGRVADFRQLGIAPKLPQGGEEAFLRHRRAAKLGIG